jgi:tetratricopeptide (TPR) repeat protein
VAKKTVKSKPVVKGQQTRNKPEPVESAPSIPTEGISYSDVLNSPYFPYLLIFFFTGAIYFNTLWNQYAIDDTLVLTENKFTLKGFGGIKDLMTHDAFVGFFGEGGSTLVSGGRYRPLSIVTLAIEVKFFGMNPKISHGINILLFTLTCLLLYHILKLLLPKKKDTPFYLSIPFIATVLFAGHPIHTEVVANIKGRDEIMGLLFSLLALFAALKYVKTQNILHLLWGTVVFFLALLSKENAITFIAIIPLTFFFFTKAKFKDYALIAGFYIIPIAAFLLLRGLYTKAALGGEGEGREILNNPFAFIIQKNADGSINIHGYLQRYATIIMTFILYIKLLIFPHPLTHDYYYNQIPITGSDTDPAYGVPLFLLSFLVNGILLIYAIMNFRKKTIPSYAILFYFITFSIVSNMFFTVGALMNERFIYMSSLGFCLFIAYLFIKAKDRFRIPVNVMMGILVVIMLLYSVKTISRNRVWLDNLTLFLVDSKTSTNSAKVNMSAGGDLTKFSDENFDELRKNGRLQYVADLVDMNVDVKAVPDSTLKKEFLQLSIQHLNQTLAIYPEHSNAWLLMGNAVYKLHKDPKEAIANYQKAILYHPGPYYDALFDIGCVEAEKNMPEQAKENFLNAIAVKPEVLTCRLNLALAYTNLNKFDSAILWYKKTLELKPLDASTYYKIGTIYGRQLNNPDMGIQYLNKAIEYDPNTEAYYEEMGEYYGTKNMPDEQIRVYEQCLRKSPKATLAMRSLAAVYEKKGNTQMAAKYYGMGRQVEDSSLYMYQKMLEKNPRDADACYKLGVLYGKQRNDLNKAIEYISKAIEYNPNVELYYEDLGVAYGLKNMPDDVIRVSEQGLKKFPNYLPVLKNIALAYQKKGDIQKLNEYNARIKQIMGQK